MVAAAWLVCVAMLLSVGCTSGPAKRGTAARPLDALLRPVTLPDMSNSVAAAQEQMRHAYGALDALVAAADTAPSTLAHAYGDLGKLFMAAQYTDAAESALLNASALESGEFRWPYYLAHLYRTKGEPDRARAQFERALQLRPDASEALVWLGDTLLSLGDVDAASSRFTAAGRDDGALVAAEFGLGRVAQAKNDPRAAVEHFERALQRDPQAVGVHYPLSLAYESIGDRARADVHRRLRQERPVRPADPLMGELDVLLESPQRYETEGIRALARQDWTAAAAAFRKGLALDPGSSALRHRLATSMNMMGDVDGAEALFSAVAHDDPGYFPTQFSLGVIVQAKGRHGEAIEHFAAALAKRPDYAEARLRMASSYRRLGKMRESLAAYEQVVTDNPDATDARLGWALTLAAFGQWGEARERLSEGSLRQPAVTAFTLGLARVLAASPDASVRDGRMAMGLVQQLLPKGRTPDLGETLAMALAELGEFERAVAVQRDLLTGAERAGLEPVQARLRRNLALYEQRRPCRTPWAEEEMP